MRVGAVRIDYLNKTFLYDASDVEPEVGQTVVIETEFGLDTGTLVEDVTDAEQSRSQPAIPKIIRVADEDDLVKIRDMAAQEKEALVVCEEEVDKAGLNMKLINARYSFDGSKVTFCYTAENRVDFRQLVRTLASRLRTRIELRQVGVRDEARLFGGIGQCGRELCCATFLSSFQPVSIRMAKEQGLPLNPLKISGICGRLFCCLKYEFDYYREARSKMPEVGNKVDFEGKTYRVISVNPLDTSVTGIDGEGQRTVIPIEVTFDPLPTHQCGGDKCQCPKHQAAALPPNGRPPAKSCRKARDDQDTDDDYDEDEEE